MKTTNRLFSLFAAILTTATLMAAVVYEPLVVDSGFNRDCIAEAYTPSYAISPYATSYLYASGITYCFATKNVIHVIDSVKNFTPTALAQATETGWPNDYRDTIKCIEDAKNNNLYKNVFWLLAPYDQPNVLTVRPDSDNDTPNQREGTLKFKKIGCYTRLFFLIVCPKLQGQTGKRLVQATVFYTDGTHTPTKTFESKGFGGQNGARVCKINCYESSGYFEKNTNRTANTAFACAYDIELDSTKLVDRIVFRNDVNLSAAVILAVTGRTADIAAPAEESTEVADIQNHQFTISWDEVGEAEMYSVDVATDEDFQEMVEGYNNQLVSKNDTIVSGLEEDKDYYWRVRSVNSDGTQSASSAPRCVRTAGNNPPETSETSENIEEMLEGYAGYRAVVPSIKIHRTLCRNGYFNTLCLPFNMNAEQIAASPIAGARVFEYVRATKTGEGLDIEISGPIDHINAGVPYLVNWEPTTPEWIGEDGLVFENVNITTYKGDTIGNNDEVQFIGNIGIANLVELDENNLFLGANNTLYYPEGGNRLKGFRSYFKIPSSGKNAVAKHTPARIVTRSETTTDIISVTHESSKAYKVLINNNLYIIQNSVMYNLQGQLVK